MRTRDEIVRSSTHPFAKDGGLRPADLKLEVLLDIRDLLVKRDEEVARCGHGTTGICMACITMNDLLRPRAR